MTKTGEMGSVPGAACGHEEVGPRPENPKGWPGLREGYVMSMGLGKEEGGRVASQEEKASRQERAALGRGAGGRNQACDGSRSTAPSLRTGANEASAARNSEPKHSCG